MEACTTIHSYMYIPCFSLDTHFPTYFSSILTHRHPPFALHRRTQLAQFYMSFSGSTIVTPHESDTLSGSVADPPRASTSVADEGRLESVHIDSGSTHLSRGEFLSASRIAFAILRVMLFTRRLAHEDNTKGSHRSRSART